MERPLPSKAYFRRLMPVLETARPTDLGLREIGFHSARLGFNPLYEISEGLNMDEMLAFAAGSYDWRARDPASLHDMLDAHAELYDIFAAANRRVLQGRQGNWWSARSLTERDGRVSSAVNTHDRKTFRDRLAAADEDGIVSMAMKEILRGPTRMYTGDEREHRVHEDDAVERHGSPDWAVLVRDLPRGRRERHAYHAHAVRELIARYL